MGAADHTSTGAPEGAHTPRVEGEGEAAPSCATCRFSREAARSAECHRSPPISNALVGRWPRVTYDEWCGEYAPAQVVLEEIEYGRVENGKIVPDRVVTTRKVPWRG